MGLPTYSIPSETVELPDGHTVEVRGLSRAEVLKMADYEGKQVEGEAQAIAWALDLPFKEVLAWHAAAPFAVVQTIVDVITRLSGTDADAGKGLSED